VKNSPFLQFPLAGSLTSPDSTFSQTLYQTSTPSSPRRSILRNVRLSNGSIDSRMVTFFNGSTICRVFIDGSSPAICTNVVLNSSNVDYNMAEPMSESSNMIYYEATRTDAAIYQTEGPTISVPMLRNGTDSLISYHGSFVAVLNRDMETGRVHFVLVNTTTGNVPSSEEYINSTIYRAAVSADGQFHFLLLTSPYFVIFSARHQSGEIYLNFDGSGSDASLAVSRQINSTAYCFALCGNSGALIYCASSASSNPSLVFNKSIDYPYCRIATSLPLDGSAPVYVAMFSNITYTFLVRLDGPAFTPTEMRTFSTGIPGSTYSTLNFHVSDDARFTCFVFSLEPALRVGCHSTNGPWDDYPSITQTVSVHFATPTYLTSIASGFVPNSSVVCHLLFSLFLTNIHSDMLLFLVWEPSLAGMSRQ
jgi:hypothetical protein